MHLRDMKGSPLHYIANSLVEMTTEVKSEADKKVDEFVIKAALFQQVKKELLEDLDPTLPILAMTERVMKAETQARKWKFRFTLIALFAIVFLVLFETTFISHVENTIDGLGYDVVVYEAKAKIEDSWKRLQDFSKQ